MSSRWYLTQHPIDNKNPSGKNEQVTKISEAEFTALLRQHWSYTANPQPVPNNGWEYHLRKSSTDVPSGDVSLLGNAVISGRLAPTRWILLTIIVQRYLKRPLYMWHDSDLDHFLEITDTTTERDVLLFFDNL